MAGFVPTEGEHLIAQLVFPQTTTDRGTGLRLGLFTNSTVSSSTTLSAITEPTGGSYARISLTDGSWTITNGVASYTAQTFTATGSAYTGTIYGYFIATTGTTPRLLAIEVDSAGPYTMAQNDSYTITPSITVV